MTDPEEITPQTSLEAFRASFIRRVGVGPSRMGYGELTDQTGISVRTLKSWADGSVMPHLQNWLKLCVVFGPEFASETLGLIGMGGVEYVDAQRPKVHECVAGLSMALNEITQRLRDDVFCHRDQAVVGPQLLALAHKLEEQGKGMIEDSKKGPHR